MQDAPTVTVGVPVYNGELAIKQALDSILAQTYDGYSILIADNGSTDNTQKICKEYASKYSKISYIRREKNIGLFQNFYDILRRCDTRYFVWLAVDDWWEPTFLESNIAVLDNDSHFVGSGGLIDYPDSPDKMVSKDQKIKQFFGNGQVYDFADKTERLSFYIRWHAAEDMYAVWRADILKNCIIKRDCCGCDLMMILKALTYGQLNIIPETLLHRSGKGVSSLPENRYRLWNDYGTLGTVLPFAPFTAWIIRNCGVQVFFKNIVYLAHINASSAYKSVLSTLRRKGTLSSKHK